MSSVDGSAGTIDLLTEEGKLAFLLQINENPEAQQRIKQLVESGLAADAIATMCNETGQLVYTGLDDPNSLPNRFKFIDLENPQYVIPGPYETVLDQSYFPTVETIYYIRGLAEKTLEGEEIIKGQPTLHTEADYWEYFKSLHPTVLEYVCRNLNNLELNKGCNGPCKDVCVAMANGKPNLYVPFPIVTWLLDEHYRLTGELKFPELFFGNDVADYEYEGKTAVDIYNHIFQKHGIKKACVVVFSLAPRTIEFLYQFIVVHKGNIARISRLKAGNIEKENQKLFEKLEERAAKDGRTLSDFDRYSVNYGLKAGNRTQFPNLKAGNGVDLNEDERTYVNGIIVGIPGVALRAGKGFEAIIPRPTSKLYPGQCIAIPITAKTQNVVVPQLKSLNRVVMPLGMDHGDMLKRTSLTIIDGTNGNIVQEDKPSPVEELHGRISAVKFKFLNLKKNLANFPGADQNRFLMAGLKDEINQQPVADGITKVVEDNIKLGAELLAAIYKVLISSIKELHSLSQDCEGIEWANADIYLAAVSLYGFVRDNLDDLGSLKNKYLEFQKANPDHQIGQNIKSCNDTLKEIVWENFHNLEELMKKIYAVHEVAIHELFDKMEASNKPN